MQPARSQSGLALYCSNGGDKKHQLLRVYERAQRTGKQTLPERPSQHLAMHLAWGTEMSSRQESKRYLCLTEAGSG